MYNVKYVFLVFMTQVDVEKYINRWNAEGMEVSYAKV